MKAREDAIKPAGLTLLYEPDWPADPAVDIVLVHGIGGHPVRSWKCAGGDNASPPAPKPTTAPYPGIKRRLTKLPPDAPLRRSNSEPLLSKDPRAAARSRTQLWKNTAAKSSPRLHVDTALGSPPKPKPPGSILSRSRTILRKGSATAASPPARQKGLPDLPDPACPSSPAASGADAYWPLDFLPASCPSARVFVWGYRALGAGTTPRRPQGDVFAHAGELLLELAAARAELGARARPVVFVALSTGGVLIKELLRLAEAERDGPLKGVLLATAAVVFLASPHRGTEHCSLGDAVKSMAGATVGVDADDPALAELCGAAGVHIERGRQAFVRLWNEYNFTVRTFQESIIPAYQHPELRAQTTIRRLASFIGDPREHAETICALHDDIGRFGSPEDQGYRALVKTLAACIADEELRRHVLNPKEQGCLAALAQAQPALPETPPAVSYPGTCLWLYELPDFQAWHNRSGPSKHKVLWIRGEAGCGKTTLLRSLRKRLERQWAPAGASFISTTADGPSVLVPHHDGNPAAVYRDLLAQLFPQDPGLRRALLALYNRPRSSPLFDDAQVVSFFADRYVTHTIATPARRTFIFVEVADDACPAYVHELLGRLSQLAHNSDFSICVASGYHPQIIEEENVISVPMHLRNAEDVLRYVNLNFIAEWEDRDRMVVRVGQKAGGVFLWAETVVNILNAAIAEGATQDMIEYTLDEVPGDLHGLYEWMLSTLNDRERAESLVLFQWAMLAAEPMRLNDLFVAVRLTEPDPFALYQQRGPIMALDVGAPLSMRELRQLRNSEIRSDTPGQFHRWLRARSIGLLELRPDDARGPAAPLGLQRVHPIHPSVRAFFMSGRGFACLAARNPSIPPALPLADFFDITHYTLLRACLTYLNMRDLEPLGHGARRRRKVPAAAAALPPPPPGPDPSPTSPTAPDSPAPLHWHPPPTVSSQRHLIMSSHPFLRYAATHLLFHLLSPGPFRYFLPQGALLAALAARRFRLWKRWTALLGTYDPDVILARHAGGAGGGAAAGGCAAGAAAAAAAASASPAATPATARLLSPVFGARFRLERVLRKVARLAASEGGGLRRRGTGEHGLPAGGPVRGADRREGEEKSEWVPGTPRLRLPEELTLPAPRVGGGLLSPLRRAGMVGEEDGEGDGEGEIGVAV